MTNGYVAIIKGVVTEMKRSVGPVCEAHRALPRSGFVLRESVNELHNDRSARPSMYELVPLRICFVGQLASRFLILSTGSFFRG